MEIGLFFVVLLIVLMGEIMIYLKLTRFMQQLSDIAMLRPELEKVAKLLSVDRSAEFTPQNKVLFQKEISVAPHEQVSRVDVKLSTVVPPSETSTPPGKN